LACYVDNLFLMDCFEKSRSLFDWVLIIILNLNINIFD